MAWSKLDIINLAANVLGKRSFNDVIDSGEFADSASKAFDLLYPVELGGNDWRFATKIQILSKTLDTPGDPYYQFAYNMPSDYLALRRTFPICRFQLYQDQLWTNVDGLKMEYRFEPDPTQCPAYFVKFFSLLLAQWYAKSVAEDSGLSEVLKTEAFMAKATGMFIDAQSRPTTPLFQNPVTSVRYSWYDGQRYNGSY